MLLDKIEKANDIKKIDKSDYGELAEEIRALTWSCSRCW